MNNLRGVLLIALWMIGGWSREALSHTLVLNNWRGEPVAFEVGREDRFLEVWEGICAYFRQDAGGEGESRGVQAVGEEMDFLVFHSGTEIVVRSKQARCRDYSVTVTKQEKKDISYIIKTLAYDSLISIGTSKSSLKAAGDRINLVHPFRFLMTVFTDEELKAGIRAIRDRGGWVWSGFIDGIVESLGEESAKGNLLSFVDDFAGRLHLSEESITLKLQQKDWSGLVNFLIDTVPRQIDPNRYNM